LNERVEEAQKSSVALGDCLMAWRRGEESNDAKAGSIVIAEFVNLVRGALRKK
jgi:hypothetical protein